MKLLFVCNANLQRSPTAEELINKKGKHKAKSCGIDPLAVRRITKKDIEWADVIFCMENVQRNFILTNFSKEAKIKDIRVLNIPDIYLRNNKELIKLLKRELREFL